jgi:hypothetical protein
MSLAVWPSTFIRIAVETCSALATLWGRPNLVPLAREACRFNAVRSLISSRSYSAREPSTPIIILPAGVDESIPSVTDTRVTPLSVRALTVSKNRSVLRPHIGNRNHHRPRRSVGKVMITGAFLAESAASVDDKLNVTGGVLEHYTVDPIQDQHFVVVILTHTQPGETAGNFQMKVRPPSAEADPLIVTGALPKEAAKGEPDSRA